MKYFPFIISLIFNIFLSIMLTDIILINNYKFTNFIMNIILIDFICFDM